MIIEEELQLLNGNQMLDVRKYERTNYRPLATGVWK